MRADDVSVVGYPIGGDSISISSGVVSRIEMQEYAQVRREWKEGWKEGSCLR